MLKGLLLFFVIFASLGTFLIGPHSVLAAEQSPKEGNQPQPVAKEANQKPPASEEVKKKVEEAKSDKNPECIGMKAQSRPSCP